MTQLQIVGLRPYGYSINVRSITVDQIDLVLRERHCSTRTAVPGSNQVCVNFDLVSTDGICVD